MEQEREAQETKRIKKSAEMATWKRDKECRVARKKEEEKAELGKDAELVKVFTRLKRGRLSEAENL